MEKLYSQIKMKVQVRYSIIYKPENGQLSGKNFGYCLIGKPSC